MYKYSKCLLSKFSRDVLDLASSGIYNIYTNKDESKIMIATKSRLPCGCHAGSIDGVFVSNDNFEFNDKTNHNLIDFSEWDQLSTFDFTNFWRTNK